MKVLKCTFIGIAFVPVVLVVVYIVYEIVGMAVNHASSSQQTKDMIKTIEAELPAAKVVDSYTDTGNTTGTGNHVDMLSVVVFTAEAPLTEIKDKLEQFYGDPNDLWIGEMAEFKMLQEERRHLYFCLNDIDIPEQTENCYVVFLVSSAPFWDNLEGH